MPRAIALLSGGLDSTLAVLLLRRQGIDVTAVTFMTHFGCGVGDSSSCSSDSTSNAQRFGFEVKMCHLADKFIDIVKHPKHGHGKNMNPCIDCRILMLKEAHELMKMRGADFLVTGEVIGQRPMSQRKETLPMIDKQAGVAGLVLRPLCARLMKPTKPELEGMVDRAQLCGFNGRSRKPQIALAAEFGLLDYPAPAGGCLLTDPIYAHRLKESLALNPEPSLRDIQLLSLGRHFRLAGGAKAIVGRDEAENASIESYATDSDILMYTEGGGSPLVMIDRSATRDDIVVAASLCARYSDLKRQLIVPVSIQRGGVPLGEVSEVIDVMPISDQDLKALRIEKDMLVKSTRR